MPSASMTTSRATATPGIAVLALCLCLSWASACAMEVERTDLEPWEPAVADDADAPTPWQPGAPEAADPETSSASPADASAPDTGNDDAADGDEVGYASYYGKRFHGRRTASGQPFDAQAATAAHRTLPLGTEVRITNLANGRSVIATITDRGPFVRGRIIDVSRALAVRLGFLRAGKAKVRIVVRSVHPLSPQ